MELDYEIVLDSNGSFTQEDCIWMEKSKSNLNFPI
jgi:hypothetical protein